MGQGYFSGQRFDNGPRQRAISVNNQNRNQYQDSNYDNDEGFLQRSKPRNGVDIEPLRSHNYIDNHYLDYPVVNRKLDKSNVRNNPKVWSKNLQEEFIPEPQYENYMTNPDMRNPMEIMTREEYSDLQHFPRTRRKYFDHTMQPNRFMFNEDRARTRDFNQDPTMRQSQFYGGKGDAYVIDESGANTNAKRKLDLNQSMDNTILYNKRTGKSRLPPYTDMKNFSRTRQAHFNQDYVRDRAANTQNQNPHRRKVNVPTMNNFAPHAQPLNHQETNMKELNRSQSTDDTWNSPQKMYNSFTEPRPNIQFNDTNGDVFSSMVNNREAWSKNVGNSNMIRSNLMKQKKNNIFGNPQMNSNNMSMVQNPNRINRTVNNRENGGKFMGSAKHFINNTKKNPQGANIYSTVY